MTASRLVVKVSCAGLFVGVAGALLVPAAHADADYPLAGSDTAIIVG